MSTNKLPKGVGTVSTGRFIPPATEPASVVATTVAPNVTMESLASEITELGKSLAISDRGGKNATAMAAEYIRNALALAVESGMNTTTAMAVCQNSLMIGYIAEGLGIERLQVDGVLKLAGPTSLKPENEKQTEDQGRVCASARKYWQRAKDLATTDPTAAKEKKERNRAKTVAPADPNKPLTLAEANEAVKLIPRAETASDVLARVKRDVMMVGLYIEREARDKTPQLLALWADFTMGLDRLEADAKESTPKPTRRPAGPVSE